MPAIRSQQNFWAGMFFLGCGIFEIVLSMQYDFGTPESMGPSFMPVLLGIGLAVLGLIIIVNALTVVGPGIEPGHWRPFVCIVAALVLFALLIKTAGLAVSTFLVVMVGGCAYRARVPWLRLVLLAIGMTIFSVVLFIYILGQQIAVWGSA
ncbi:MAG: tripartite tricarboxylate transporter TctB family protein [Bradyrhizobium sp.]